MGSTLKRNNPQMTQTDEENYPQMTQMAADEDKRVDADRDPQTYAILGAAIEVHRVLGAGFLEAVYQESLSLELAGRGIPHRREVPISVKYKGQDLACSYRPDFVCFDDVLVELKALAALTSLESAIAINYLKATGFHRLLLVNFGTTRLEFKRLIYGESHLSS